MHLHNSPHLISPCLLSLAMETICAISSEGSSSSFHFCIARPQSTVSMKVHQFSLGSLQMQDLQHSLESILVHFSPSQLLLLQGKGNQNCLNPLQIALLQKLCESVGIECQATGSSHLSSVNQFNQFHFCSQKYSFL